MAKRSRDKGAEGEREVVRLAREFGIRAERRAQLQAKRILEGDRKHPDVSLLDWPSIFLEVKRDERMSVDAMVRQAISDASHAQAPLVAWRRNKGKWRIDIPAQFFFFLLKRVRL